jgi:peroxiredoxin
MKKHLFIAGALLMAVIGSAFMASTNEITSLEIGAKAPLADAKMKNIDNTEHSLASLNGENGLLVVFSCNTCPFVIGREGKSEGWEGRYNELHQQAAALGVNMVLVNSNEAKRTGDDSMEAMVKHASAVNYKMPYLLDENHQLADAFGARTTPHVYLFNKDLTLAYKGAIDDNVDSSKEVKEHYLSNAMMNMVKGKKAKPEETKPLGCSIKRVEK